jgi:hypothetical protein
VEPTVVSMPRKVTVELRPEGGKEESLWIPGKEHSSRNNGP